MKLGPLAFRLLQRAYDAAVRAPGDCAAHERLFKWARLASRVIGKQIVGCHITNGTGRAQWIRWTALVVLFSMATHLGISGKSPVPPRTVGPLMIAVTSTAAASSMYITDENLGRQILAWPPLVRKPSTTIKDT